MGEIPYLETSCKLLRRLERGLGGHRAVLAALPVAGPPGGAAGAGHPHRGRCRAGLVRGDA